MSKKLRSKESDIQRIDSSLRGMQKGTSVFISDHKPSELTLLRRRAYKLDIKIEMRYVENDSIYVGKSGTRIWHRGKVDGR